MSYASLLVHVELDRASEARVELAAGLAHTFEAALIGVAAGMTQPPFVEPHTGVVIDGEMMRAEEEQLRADLKAAEATFRSNIAVEGLQTDFRSAADFPANVLVNEARSADLIVMGRNGSHPQIAYQYANPGDVLMAVGRPLLIVPPETITLRAEHVLVGWKDTREARRAVRDALPFLKRASMVHVIEVAEEMDLAAAEARATDVARYLERHKVSVRAESHIQRGGSVADDLILAAEQHGADLIVTGGYGHARVREWVFGGVTQDLLKHCPKCCLLSH